GHLNRNVDLSSGFECLLTAIVGFLQELPTTLIAAFKSTLEEVTEADLLLDVVDASHEGYVEQEETVHSILAELDAHTIPMLTVYNKKDLLERDFVGGTSPNTISSAYNKQD